MAEASQATGPQQSGLQRFLSPISSALTCADACQRHLLRRGLDREANHHDTSRQEGQPWSGAFRLFPSGMWKKHPYASSFGTLNLCGVQPGASYLQHFRRHYAIKNLTLAVVGDVEPTA